MKLSHFWGEIPWISGFLLFDFVMVYLTIYHPDGFEIPCACMPFSQVKALWNNETEDTSSWHDSTGIPVPCHWWPPSWELGPLLRFSMSGINNLIVFNASQCHSHLFRFHVKHALTTHHWQWMIVKCCWNSRVWRRLTRKLWLSLSFHCWPRSDSHLCLPTGMKKSSNNGRGCSGALAKIACRCHIKYTVSYIHDMLSIYTTESLRLVLWSRGKKGWLGSLLHQLTTSIDRFALWPINQCPKCPKTPCYQSHCSEPAASWCKKELRQVACEISISTCCAALKKANCLKLNLLFST